MKPRRTWVATGLKSEEPTSRNPNEARSAKPEVRIWELGFLGSSFGFSFRRTPRTCRCLTPGAGSLIKLSKNVRAPIQRFNRSTDHGKNLCDHMCTYLHLCAWPCTSVQIIHG